MIIGGSGSGKTNALLNLIKEQDHIDQDHIDKPICMQNEDVGTKHFCYPNVFIECSNTMDDVYENIDDYNPNRQRNISIVFDDMIAGIMSNKNFKQ